MNSLLGLRRLCQGGLRSRPYIRRHTNRTDVFEDLKQRGLLQDTTVEHSALPRGCAVYVGFDPTASSLHIGNLLQITTLQRLANVGYKPIALVSLHSFCVTFGSTHSRIWTQLFFQLILHFHFVFSMHNRFSTEIGGATGQIGDPSGRSTERNLLSVDEVEANVQSITRQFNSFFKGDLKIKNNIDWYKDMLAIEFLRDIGKLFRVNTMLAKDSVKSRIETDYQGISFTEFSYQILQSYDFYHLYKNENCLIQFGGSDQWGNITAGIEFVKKKSQQQSFGFTIPLVTDSEGKKIGKSSAGGQIWLDSARTSVFDFYQFWFNISDVDLAKMLKILEEHNKQPEKRYGQEKLAHHMTKYIYGAAGAEQAVAATKVAFGGDLKSLTVREIELAFQDNQRLVEVSAGEVIGKKVVDVALAAKTAVSKSQVLKLFRGGGLYLNNERVDLEDAIFTEKDLIGGKIGVFRSGKKQYHLLKIK